MEDLNIGRFTISNESEAIIIAEVGINHEGSIESCLEHIREAGKAGAHIIKLQTIDADENYVEGTLSHEVFKNAELTKEETQKAFDLTRELGMEPMTTFGDFQTLEWRKELEPPAYKISSGLLTSTPIIEEVASFNKTVLMSTGMANQGDIKQAVETVKKHHNMYGVFQCTSSYPCELDTLNLSFMDQLKSDYGCHIGFSDHSLGVDGSLWAIARGATFIEKHFSLDPSKEGFDHKISLDPAGLKELCEKAKLVKAALGNGRKEVSADIEEKRKFFQRCLVARRSISKGETFTRDNLAIKRPLPESRGLEPSFFHELIGRQSVRDISVNEPIVKGDLGLID